MRATTIAMARTILTATLAAGGPRRDQTSINGSGIRWSRTAKCAFDPKRTRPAIATSRDSPYGSSLKLDHVGAGQGDLVNDRARHSVSRELVLVAVISRHSIHGHDHLEATQRRRNGGEENAIVRGGSNENDRCDPLVPEHLLQAGILVPEHELVDK